MLKAHRANNRLHLYDAFSSPAFKKAKDLVLPIESVYATIEVKSTLTNAELEKR